jgi:hypothetical protein
VVFSRRSDSKGESFSDGTITEKNMKQEDVVILEWTFSPPDYFEDEIHFQRDDYEMIIGKGKVEAKIAPYIYIKNSSMREQLHRSLDDRFLGAQLLAHKPYELSQSSMYRLHQDGRRDITVFPESCVLTLAVGTVDIIAKDKNGNVISDSRKDRIEKKKALADLAEKYRDSDPTTASILSSYKAAVNDANNELGPVNTNGHFYEILRTWKSPTHSIATSSRACRGHAAT